MPRYSYILTVSKNLTALEAIAAKMELCRLFETAEVSDHGSKAFKIVSRLEAVPAGDALQRFRFRFGKADLLAGGKLD